MFKKVCFSPESASVSQHSHDEISANPKLVERMTKLANGIKAIAPRSDDFLYFSIIFLKSAESAILDEGGNIKKTSSGENAWGFFDENWKWHGNVKPHRNNNKDIFPESELKVAAKKWIGMPLCRDHESSSVDGIRGIILDAHYDEKFKQVVGLCALDKVNYPDLARKVETGLVRYGSMGTAVETSICTECGNRAKTQNEYCEHINNRVAHGEVNVGLKPIEYSLVVQPAEPGAVLLRCIASLKEYKGELKGYGVGDVDAMLGKLSVNQAQHLEGILKTACGDNACSVTERKNIVKSFLKNNSLLKKESEDKSFDGMDTMDLTNMLRAISESAKAESDPGVSQDTKSLISNLVEILSEKTGNKVSREEFTSTESVSGVKGSGDVPFYSAAPATERNMLGGGNTGSRPDFGNEPIFPSNDDDLLSYPSGGEPTVTATEMQNHNVKVANNDYNDYVDDFSINSIMEEIMNESRLRKRAELRRRIAYMQGGAEGAEPNTYKSEDWNRDQDKHMQQTGNMGGAAGMHPGDKETKEKLSRAELKERRMKRLAYMQGGSEGAEPNTYKSEDWNRDQDKHMQQTGNMGGAAGMHPGDKEAKEKLSRAAYQGPALKTRFSLKRRADGSVDRGSSTFEVFAGDRRVIAATAGQIYGTELAQNWEWVSSQDYGKEVCAQIRTVGLDKVAGLLKAAQEGLPELPELPGLPEEPAAAGPDAAPEAPEAAMPEAPEADEDMPAEAEDAAPSDEIENRLAEVEALLDDIRGLVQKLEDESTADVDVNVFTGQGKEGESVSAEEGGLAALSSDMLVSLKTAYRRLDNSADELSLVAETYDNIAKLSSSNRSQFEKLASAAIKDADQLTGEARGLYKAANAMMENMSYDSAMASDGLEGMTLEVAEADDMGMDHMDMASDEMSMGMDHMDMASDEMSMASDDLVAQAMELRKQRRREILKQAEERVLQERANRRTAMARGGDEVAEDAVSDQLSELIEGSPEASAIMETTTAEPIANADDGMEATANNEEDSLVKAILSAKVSEKKADEERENYRIKLRRAYDVGLEMQRKGLLPHSKTALDRQVDEIMTFDGNAFEAFKRSIANARSVGSVKIASDLGGLNIGVDSSEPAVQQNSSGMTAETLSSMWE